MLTITIPAVDHFDEIKNEFISSDEITLHLEHSLVSLSKWESVWNKPFLGPEDKSTEEAIGYVKAMTLTPDVPPSVYDRLTTEHFEQVSNYINEKMSATWFNERQSPRGRREIITSEVIYYWMIEANIPNEYETWHLNRLFTLIKVINNKRAPAKKMTPQQAAAERRALNEQRKAQMGTKG